MSAPSVSMDPAVGHVGIAADIVCSGSTLLSEAWLVHAGDPFILPRSIASTPLGSRGTDDTPATMKRTRKIMLDVSVAGRRLLDRFLTRTEGISLYPSKKSGTEGWEIHVGSSSRRGFTDYSDAARLTPSRKPLVRADRAVTSKMRLLERSVNPRAGRSA